MRDIARMMAGFVSKLSCIAIKFKRRRPQNPTARVMQQCYTDYGTMAVRRCTYKETSPCTFSLSSFSWREVKLRAAPSFPSKRPTKLTYPRNGGGGFGYSESSFVSSPCRNRFITWHYVEGHLKLLEVSLDVPLVQNALELVLDNSDHLLPDVCIYEYEKSEVVVLFATTTTAYRLLLPHPEKIIKVPSLSAVGEGRIPSVLAFASEKSFVGSNMAALFNQPSSVIPITSCESCIDLNGNVVFALSSPSGVISLIQLPSPQQQGLPIRSELCDSSMMSKLLSSFLPVVGMGGGASGESVASLTVHSFKGQIVVVSLCEDVNLRLWSTQLRQCVMTHNLTKYIHRMSGEEGADVKVDQLILKKAEGSSPTVLKIGIHFRTPLSSQISLFELMLIENQLHLQHLRTYLSPQNGTLVDFCVSGHEVWGLWMHRDEEDTAILKQAIYDADMSTGWREVSLTPLPTKDPVVLPHQESREYFLESIFHPGRFSTQAIIKALELYEPLGNKERVWSAQELSKEVVLRVDHEIQSSASSLEMDSDEYCQLTLKCWSKFYVCCHEYQQLASKPFSVFQDPGTGMGLLIKQGVVSFLKPVTLTECESSEDIPLLVIDRKLGKDVAKFLGCIKKTLKPLDSEVLNSFLLELGRYDSLDTNPPISLAQDIADAIRDEAWDTEVYSDLYLIRNLGAVLTTLLETLDPLDEGMEGGVAEDMEDEEEYEDFTELRTAISQLFGSPIAMTMLSSAFQEACHSRLCLCRDILIMLCLVKRGECSELMPTMGVDYHAPFSQLVLSYYSLYWFSIQTAIRPSVAAHETNLLKLAMLEITSGGGHRGTQDSAPLPCPVLPLLYLSTQGHEKITARLAEDNIFKRSTPYHSHWSVLMPRMVEILIHELWPISSAGKVAEFLLENGQCNHLQSYVTLVANPTPLCGHTLQFLLGRCFIYTGELEKAFHCFVGAESGISSRENPLLQHLCEWDKSDKDGSTIRYFQKVMRLFEQIPSPLHVIRVAMTATMLVSKGHPNLTIFWSTLFKNHLELGHAREAYDAMTTNPDQTLRMDCLRRLVVVLTEQNRIKELCGFRYSGLEREIEDVMETRARAVDVMKYNYYELLYCFHSRRYNFRKAASLMYECAMRLGREASGLQSLRKQANCYSVAITALHLIEPKYAWVVRPIQEGKSSNVRRSHRKRVHPSSQKASSSKRPVEVLTICDLEKEYMVVRAKLTLLQREPSLATQLSSPFISPDEVCTLLVQAGMFDTAINISKSLSLSLVHIYKALATRCVHLSTYLVGLNQLPTEKEEWEWLNLNESLHVSKVRENSIADKAWSLLKVALERLRPEDHAVMQRSVAEKLLSMGKPLPQWILEKYKSTNLAELLTLYLTFDLLEPATLLAIEYIEGVMGHGKEFFGLENALHAFSPCVWVPYSILSHLKLALKEAPQDTKLDQLSERLNAKLDDYLAKEQSATLDREQNSTRRC